MTSPLRRAVCFAYNMRFVDSGVTNSISFFFLIFIIYIYILNLFTRDTEGSRDTGNGEADSMQAARCRTGSPDWDHPPEPRQTLNRWATQGPPFPMEAPKPHQEKVNGENQVTSFPLRRKQDVYLMWMILDFKCPFDLKGVGVYIIFLCKVFLMLISLIFRH